MNALSELQQAIIARLTATDAKVPSLTPANGQVQWVTEDIGDLANAIARATGKVGIIGIVVTPAGKLIAPEQGPDIAFNAMVEVQIQENVTINRGASGTQITALDLVQFVWKRLHWYERNGQKIRRVMLDEIPWLLVAEAPILVYNVRFITKVSVQ